MLRAVSTLQLPFRATWQDLKEFFAEAGTVVRADTHSYPGGKSKGTGIVTFASPEGAAAAIQMAGKDFQGRPIAVREFIVYPKKQQQESRQQAKPEEQ
jgi:RNA recognition motif-containing protein